tara:strand:+ start:280 stop:582 length:303 start_codon:yes stop_codon:yes gene_type:complete
MSSELTFERYYEHYLALHQNKWCRRLHVLGQFITIFFVILCISHKIWFFLLLTPFVVYPFAWAGHYLFEKNKPAAFKNPLWAKACDWIMFKDIMVGKIPW